MRLSRMTDPGARKMFSVFKLTAAPESLRNLSYPGAGLLIYRNMVCPERSRLLINYRDAVHHYSECVHDLVEMIALEIVGTDTDMLRRRVREAWDASEKARVSVARHEANHFCDRDDFKPAESIQS